MADNVIQLEDYSVVIETEKFNLTKIPDATTKLVENEKARILGTLNLQNLIDGLQRSGKLLYLAYNGVAGFGDLRAATNALQDKLALLCRDTELTLDKFAKNTAAILTNLERNYKFLVQGKEKIALAFLKQCADQAKTMATEADALAVRFDGLADETVKVCGSTEIQQGKTDEEKRQLEADREKLKADQARTQELATQLGELRKKLEGLYEEMKAKADEASNRAFGLQLTSAILGPIAQGLGAFAAAGQQNGKMAASLMTGVPLPPSPPAAPDTTSDQKSKDASKEAQEALEKAKTEAQRAKSAFEAASEELRKAKEALTGKEAEEKVAQEALDAAKSKDANDPKIKELEATLKTILEEKQKVEVTFNEKKAAAESAETASKNKSESASKADQVVKAAAAGLATAADSLGAAGNDYMKLAGDYEKEKKEFLNKLIEYQDKEANALADLAGYARRMTSVDSLIEVQKTVSASLSQAIKAFNNVAQILRNAAGFWHNMAEACKSLGSEGIQADVKAFEDLPPEDRMEMWKDDSFKEDSIRYMAGWKALELICTEYAETASKTRQEVQHNITTSPSPEESLKNTPTLAQELLIDATRATNRAQTISQELKAAAA